MGKVTNSQDVTFEFTPWTSTGYRIIKLQMSESLGGEIAGGKMEMQFNGSDNALEKVTEQLTGELLMKGPGDKGVEYKFPVYIVNRAFFRNILTLEFKCIKSNSFFSDYFDLDFSDIRDAIEKLYPGNTDNIRAKSDVGNNIKFWQFGDTNYEVCTRLAWSYKKDSIFGYGFNGLLIKDLEEPDRPEIEMSDNVFKRFSPYTLNYNRELNNTPHDTWKKDYSSSKKVNPVVYTICGKPMICHKDVGILLENYMWNTNRFRVGLYSKETIKSTFMPTYLLGDVIKYKPKDENSKYPFEKYIVSGNDVFYSSESSERDESGLGFSWTTTLFGLERGKWNDEENKE